MKITGKPLTIIQKKIFSAVLFLFGLALIYFNAYPDIGLWTVTISLMTYGISELFETDVRELLGMVLIAISTAMILRTRSVGITISDFYHDPITLLLMTTAMLAAILLTLYGLRETN